MYTRDSHIIVVQPGGYRYLIGSGDYTLLPLQYKTPKHPLHPKQHHNSTTVHPTVTTDIHSEMIVHLIQHHLQKLKSGLELNECPTVLTVPPSWSHSEKEAMTKTLFEIVNVPALYLIDQPIASLFGIGLMTGCVVDIGYECSSITCIVDTTIIAQVVVPLGGKDIDELLQLQLNQSELLIAKQQLECGGGKRKVMVDSGMVEIDCEVIECLFEPTRVGKSCFSVQEAIVETITSCEPSRRIAQWENIILCGGL
jgi:actin-related protein